MFHPAKALRACAAATIMLAGARAAEPGVVFTETQVAGGLTSPTAIAAAPDGRVFIAEQGGTIRLVKNDTLVARPFAQVPADDYGERGLLGLALDPAFSANGYVYLYYSMDEAGRHNRVTRLVASGDTALPGELLLLRAAELSSAYQWSHTGGGLEVGPDGTLYIGTGDQEVMAHGQDTLSSSGKILRINTDGSIPADNPWAGSPHESARAIWAVGLRNPFKLGVDRVGGKVWANDVGWGAFEEVNEIHKKRNYGWGPVEGPTPDSLKLDFTDPAHYYKHGPDCAVMGGDVYRPEARRLPERYVGAYFFIDFCTGRIRVMEPDADSAVVFATVGTYSTDLAFNREGNLYYIRRGYATGFTNPGVSAAFKITFADSSGGTGLRASRARAPGEGLAWTGAGRLRVPPGMTAVTLHDLMGRKVWEARGLTPGDDLALPERFRGVSRVAWRAR